MGGALTGSPCGSTPSHPSGRRTHLAQQDLAPQHHVVPLIPACHKLDTGIGKDLLGVPCKLRRQIRCQVQHDVGLHGRAWFEQDRSCRESLYFRESPAVQFRELPSASLHARAICSPARASAATQEPATASPCPGRTLAAGLPVLGRCTTPRDAPHGRSLKQDCGVERRGDNGAASRAPWSSDHLQTCVIQAHVPLCSPLIVASTHNTPSTMLANVPRALALDVKECISDDAA